MDELVNKLVMVHPHLKHDPVAQQGAVGTLIKIVPENDEVFVRFESGILGLYSMDALLTVKPGAFLFAQYVSGVLNLQESELQTLKKAYLLINSGEGENEREAMKMLSQNERTRNAGMVSIQDWIDRKMSRFQNDEERPIRRR